MDKKFEGRVVAALRKVSFSYPPRKEAKNACKVDSCLFKCCKCESLIYEGQSETNRQKFEVKYNQKVFKEKFQMDHIEPVIKPGEGRKTCKTFGEYVARLVDGLFVSSDKFQGLCQSCHSLKTLTENEERKENRRKEDVKKK